MQCDICGKEVKNEAGLRLHKYHSHNWRPKNNTVEKNAVEVVEETKGHSQNCECGRNNWRFLNKNNYVESKAINDGFVEVCSSCQTIR